ncbi:hypothetical protein [Kocuria rosea]|uniref:hypothetical protein n=1 Tax=Kocuria rosea TaxID=1275 RepID=UPI002012FAD4|nr:hypothetical protein [Kocuria rosea]
MLPLFEAEIPVTDRALEPLKVIRDSSRVRGARCLHVRQYSGLPVPHHPNVGMDSAAVELPDSLVSVLGAALVDAHAGGGLGAAEAFGAQAQEFLTLGGDVLASEISA